MIDIRDAAKYFLTKPDYEVGDAITHLKLQKICYYAQAWHLAINHTPLLDTTFEAWAHGPVSPLLWQEYRSYGSFTIPCPTDFDTKIIDDETIEFLDDVWNAYGRYTAKYLEDLTHQEKPWLEARKGYPEGARCNVPINPKTMESYYWSIIENGEE